MNPIADADRLGEILRDALPVVLGVFAVILVCAIARWAVWVLEQVLDAVVRITERRR